MLKINKVAIKTFWISLVLICVALVFTIIKTQLYRIHVSKKRVISTLEHIVGRPVSVGSLKLEWNGFDPVLKLAHVGLLSAGNDDANHPSNMLEQLNVEFSLLNSVLHWQWTPAHVSVKGLNVVVNKISPSRFRVRHFGVLTPGMLTHGQVAWYNAMPRWSIKFSGVSLLYKANHQQYHFKDLTFDYSHGLARRAVASISGNVDQKKKMHFLLQVDLSALSSPNYTARSHLELGEVNLNLLNQLIPLRSIFPHWRFSRGVVNANIDSYWYHQHWGHVKYAGEIRDFHAVLFKPDRVGSTAMVAHSLNMDKLLAKIAWQRSSSGWKLRLHDLVANIDHRTLPLHDFIYSIAHNDGHVWEKISLNEFDLRDLGVLVQLLPRTLTRSLNMTRWENCRGTLSDVSMESFSHHRYGNIKASFSSLYVPVFHRFPGVGNLSGRLQLGSNGGWINIHGGNSEILLAGQSQPIWLRLFSAEMFYHRAGPKMMYSLRNFALKNDDLSLSGSADVARVGGQSPNVNAKLHFHFNKLSDIRRYFPYSVMRPNLRRWLGAAFIAGKLNNGVAQFSGRVSDFPFDHHQGEFKVTGDLDDVQLHFSPHWSNVKNIVGKITFLGRSMTVAARSAQLDGNHVGSLRATIHDLFYQPQLNLHLDAAAEFKNGFRLLRHSLFSVYQRLSLLHAKGMFHLKLGLRIPLGYPRTIKYQGDLLLNHAVLSSTSKYFVLRDVNGHLLFSPGSFRAEDLHARFFHTPLKMRLSTLGSGRHRLFQFHVAGVQDLADLFRRFHYPLSHFMQGKMHFKAIINWPYDPLQGGELSVSSGLRDVRVDAVPEFLVKKSSNRMPSRLMVAWSPHVPATVQFHYGRILYGRFNSTVASNGVLHQVTRLAFSSPRFALECSGVCVTGQLARLSWARLFRFYQDVVTRHWPRFNNRGNQSVYVHLLVNQLHVFDQSFDKVHVLAIHLLGDWQARLQSGKAIFNLRSPVLQHPSWKIQLSHIKLKPLSVVRRFSSDYPAVQFSAHDLRYGAFYFDRLYWQSVPAKSALIIHALRIRTPSYSLTANGSWQEGQHVGLSLKGRLMFSNIGQVLLKRWRLHLLRDGEGQADFTYFSPHFAPILSTGSVLDLNFDFKNAQLQLPLSQSKRGLLKLINLVDLSAIPEHVRSGFHDLMSKELPLRQAKGHIIVNNAITYLNRVDITGESVNLSLNGKINSENTSCDLVLSVYPDVMAGLPLVSAIAAGPMVGTIAWVVSKIIQPHIRNAVVSRYRIRGAFNHPDVTKIS